MELGIECESERAAFWVIFVHASIDAKERQQEWEFLKIRKQKRRSKWVMWVILMILLIIMKIDVERKYKETASRFLGILLLKWRWEYKTQRGDLYLGQ